MPTQNDVNEMPYADKKSIQLCAVCGRAITRDTQTGRYFHVYPINTRGGKSQYFCYPYNTRSTATPKKPIKKLSPCPKYDPNRYKPGGYWGDSIFDYVESFLTIIIFLSPLFAAIILFSVCLLSQ